MFLCVTSVINSTTATRWTPSVYAGQEPTILKISTLIYRAINFYTPILSRNLSVNIASIFNYCEAVLWFSIALIIFLRRKNANVKLTKLAMLLSISFFFFGISDLIEANTGAWWRPWWLLVLKALCILSFVTCWYKYR